MSIAVPHAFLAALLMFSAGLKAMGQAVSTTDDLSVVHLETNATPEPLGIDDPSPKFSWRLENPHTGVKQASFRVRVGAALERLHETGGTLWDSGEIDDHEQSVDYGGTALEARTRYFWSVRVRSADGGDSGWSDAVWFETALLDPDDWVADWIAGPERSMTRLSSPEGVADDAAIREAGEFCRPVGWPSAGFFPDAVPNPEGGCRALRPVPMLRTSFQVEKPVEDARIYTSGLAYNDLRLNGTGVSDAVLDPGFTDYSRTVLFTTHDVTDLLRQGENVIATQLDSGQFDSSTRTWDWGWDIAEWRATPRLRLQLHVRYADGTEDVIRTHDSWKASTDGPTRYDSYYLGETYDARREIAGWDRPGFDASAWEAARRVDAPAGIARAQTHEPIRIVDVRAPGTRTEPRPGVVLYDVGQNLTGWARIRLEAPAGSAIEIFYSEKLDSLGAASNDPGYALVGGQLQTDYYVAKGGGAEIWAPRFSYKGFQYVQLSGPGGEPLPDGVTVELEAIEQVRSDLHATASFDSGSTLLGRIHQNARWAVESNLHGIITDTPIYEKNPWTGDAQLSAGVIATLFDARRLYGKLFQDMVDAQTEAGEVPLLAPSNEHYGYVGKPAFKPVDCCGATPAWDAYWFIIPWEAYMRYGDQNGLNFVYPAMQRYLDDWIPRWTERDGDAYAHTLTAGLGDWDPPEGTPTNISLASTAYYARFAEIAANVARVLGFDDDEARYLALFERIRTDFNLRFLSSDGIYRDQADDPFTQTAQVLPLAFGLVPREIRGEALKRLVADLQARDHNAYVGILGARYLLPVLSESGYADVAYEVATQTDYPSWGYWTDSLGWTGLGEYWESTSRSRNHHFFGTIVQWMYEHLVGMRPLDPGYARIAFRPEIPAGLDHASASYRSVRGVVSAAWRQSTEALEFDVTVPPNATGVVYLEASSPEAITWTTPAIEAGQMNADAVRYTGEDEDHFTFEVGSGSYRFRIAKGQ